MYKKRHPQYVRIYNGRQLLVPFKEAVRHMACRILPQNAPIEAIKAGVVVIDSIIIKQSGIRLAYDEHQEYYGDILKAVDACFPDYMELELSEHTDPEPYGEDTHTDILELCGFDMRKACHMARVGKSRDEILKHFFGLDIKEAYLGEKLETVGFGARGDSVRTVQSMLNRIRRLYPSIPRLKPDGIFAQSTECAVKELQRIRGIEPDGVVGRCTRIELLYAAWGADRLMQHALNRVDLNVDPPAAASSGEAVEGIKRVMCLLGEFYPELDYYAQEALSEPDYGQATAECISRLQKMWGSTGSGVLTSADMYNLIRIYLRIVDMLPAACEVEKYPGYQLYENCVDGAVRVIGQYLQVISGMFDIPCPPPDEVFTPRMHNAVVQFQLLFMPDRADGIIDLDTWDKICLVYCDVLAAQW